MKQAPVETIDQVLMGQFLTQLGLVRRLHRVRTGGVSPAVHPMPATMTKFATNITVPKVMDGTFRSLFDWDHKEGAATLIIGMWVVIAVMFVTRESIARTIVPNHTVHVRQKIYEALLKRYEEEYRDSVGQRHHADAHGRTLRLPGRVGAVTYHPLLHGHLDLFGLHVESAPPGGHCRDCRHRPGALNVGLHMKGLLSASDRREQQLVETSR